MSTKKKFHQDAVMMNKGEGGGVFLFSLAIENT